MFASICGIYRDTSNIRSKVLGPDDCGNGNSAINKGKFKKCPYLIPGVKFLFSFLPLVTIIFHHMDVFLLVKLVSHT